MNPAEAVRARRDLSSRHSIGMHFGTFQLTLEAIDQPRIDLERARADSGLATTEFVTLNEGETLIYYARRDDPGACPQTCPPGKHAAMLRCARPAHSTGDRRAQAMD